MAITVTACKRGISGVWPLAVQVHKRVGLHPVWCHILNFITQWPCNINGTKKVYELIIQLVKILRLVCREQGKSEGFESCDRPIVRKRPIWVKIGDVLYHVTLKLDGWPWKTTGHLSFAVSSFVQHLIAIGEFKLELQSGNAQFGSNSPISRAVWPWNLTYDLEKQKGTTSMLLQALFIIS